MKRLGLLGKNIAYSFSKKFFETKFTREKRSDQWVYEVFDVNDETKIAQLFSLPNLVGFNVTTPYKEEIIKHLDALDETAEAVGAVNTVVYKAGKWMGFNTDVVGFRESLKPLLQSGDDKALVLGTGGASKAVCFALGQLGIGYRMVSRKAREEQITYADLETQGIDGYSLIINCTPLGTFPNIGERPDFPYKYLTPKHLLYDLVYNPSETAFLKSGLKYESRTKNGLEMLHLQAEAAWSIWQTK